MSPNLFEEMFGTSEAPTIPLSLKDVPLQAQVMAGYMSISGVQPKLVLKLDKRKNELTVAQTDGEYILKPQIPHFPQTPENENCCMDIAQAFEIEVPPHCLLPLKDGSLAYAVKRFDRVSGEKINQESFYQILEKRDKYMGSLEQIGNSLKQISVVPGLDVQLFFELVVFNFLIGNGDAHFKNYSISYLKDGIRLSPAYDLVCSKLVIPGDSDSALTINGKKNNLRRGDFDVLAAYLKIPEKVRYDKFAGQLGKMEQLIRASQLSADFKKTFIQIVSSRFDRLKLVN